MNEPHTPPSQGDEIHCPNCGVTFRLDDLKRQLAQGKFACPVCGSGFTQPKTVNRKILFAAVGIVLVLIVLAIIKNTSFYVVQNPPITTLSPAASEPHPIKKDVSTQIEHQPRAIAPASPPQKPIDIAIIPVAKGIYQNRFSGYKPKSPEYSFSVKNTGTTPLDSFSITCKMSSVQHNTVLCTLSYNVDKLSPQETSTIKRVTIPDRDLTALLGNNPINFDIRVEIGIRKDGELIVYRTDYYESSMFQ